MTPFKTWQPYEFIWLFGCAGGYWTYITTQQSCASGFFLLPLSVCVCLCVCVARVFHCVLKTIAVCRIVSHIRWWGTSRATALATLHMNVCIRCSRSIPTFGRRCCCCCCHIQPTALSGAVKFDRTVTCARLAIFSVPCLQVIDAAVHMTSIVCIYRTFGYIVQAYIVNSLMQTHRHNNRNIHNNHLWQAWSADSAQNSFR